uniref:Protocadherin-8 n=1 Tax=Xenopus laevis TaxID=8355 RepID=O93509_XENLA|nr:paraxial protocadherin [Xenopus laevis]
MLLLFRAIPMLLLGLMVLQTDCEIAQYYIDEEEPPGTVIAVLSQHSIFNTTDIPATNFRLMKQFNNSLIGVRESDGQLSIMERIDREQICRQSLHCNLALDVVSFSKGHFKLLNVKVEVRDINDHSPHFPSEIMHVEVSESSSVGTRIPLEIAIDEDVGSNSIQNFQISNNSHFSIDVLTRADGVKYADLVLMRELDREIQPTYIMELLAMDGGVPSLSGTAVVNIRVLDFNDNSPVFERSTIAVDLVEDAPLGYLLLELHATDDDEGVNGEIVYGFSTLASQEVRQLFKINSRTGSVTLEGQVDFETKQTYEFEVQAQDLGPNPLTATCKVTVHILDVNDNTPAITITPLTTVNAGVAYIPETATKENFIALISTTDRASGSNGQVRCTLYGHEHFKLQQAYEDSYMIVTTSTLDRENIAAYSLTVVAEDLGFPSLKTKKYYTVKVSDENDNAPVFSKPQYEASILENNAPGSYITTVIARDSDSDQNGKVNYRLVDAKVMGQSLTTFVSLDADSGVLRAVRSLDYEKLKQLDFEIEAADNGIPQLSTRVQLNLRIVDQNDNCPVITNPLLNNGSGEVLLPISAPQNYLVFQLKAEDSDEGHNSQLFYTILRDPSRLFAINKESGEVFLKKQLNSDHSEDLSIVVAVYDLGRPSLSTNATVKFILTDSFPSNVEVVILQPSAEEQHQIDMSIIFIAVLAGGCALLLLAIFFVACTCKKKAGEFKQVPEQHGTCNEERLLSTPSPQSVSSSLSQSESCQLSINTESENCSVSSNQEQHQQTGIKHSISVPSYHTSGWHLDNCAMSISGHSHMGHISTKDSGKGDSDFNDSDSDTSGESQKKSIEQPMQAQASAQYTDESAGFRHADNYFSHRINKGPENGNCTLQYEKGYRLSYSVAPAHYNTYHARMPNLHIPNHTLRDPYYHINNPVANRMHAEYERDLVNRSATLSPQRSSSRYQEFNYSPQISRQLHPSEIATTF